MRRREMHVGYWGENQKERDHWEDREVGGWIILKLKNAVFWDVAPCRSCVNQCSYETSVYTKYTQRHILEDGILHSHRRESFKSYNTKIDLGEIIWVSMNWIDLTQDRDQWRAIVNTVINFQVPENVGKFLSSCATGGFSKRSQLHEFIYESYLPKIHKLTK
jgi:hypothetical protein